MSSYVITGKNKLNGEVTIETSKNATLPILAASVMSNGIVTIKNIPNFSDIDNMLKILQEIGVKVNKINNDVTLDARGKLNYTLPKELTSKIRASIFLLGPLLAKLGKASSYMPGGCNIGKRPIDIHLSGFKDLGITVTETSEKIICDASEFTGGKTKLRFASVGATENLIMCACLSYLKTTIIENAAKEPEIIDLCNFINSMGGKIYGAGTDKIVIVGVKQLNGIVYTPIPDRIIAGTYLIGAAMCGGKVVIKNVNPMHNESLIANLISFGCKIDYDSDNIYLESSGFLKANGKQFITNPYPGFSTDLQAQTMAMLSVTDGNNTITENLFETRFKQADELVKMGACIKTDGNVATIYGKHGCLKSSLVNASDLRGGASLVLAALVAEGTTTVQNIEYIERGYDNFDKKLNSLGADIKRIQ